MEKKGVIMIFIDTGAFFASKVKNDVIHLSAVKIDTAFTYDSHFKQAGFRFIG